MCGPGDDECDPEFEGHEGEEGPDGEDFDDLDPDTEEYDRNRFADPGGKSSLHPATPDNPRDLPCGSCGRENMLTPLDKASGYQCDICAEETEGGY